MTHFDYMASRGPANAYALSRLTTARGMPGREAFAQRGYKHAEAFCLMLYQCQGCFHREVLWNSRDGVTPFGTSCPTCGAQNLLHTDFASDWCVPEHQPHFGQRVWISMTEQRAIEIARIQVLSRKKETRETLRLVEQVAESIYHQGEAPDIAIAGVNWPPIKRAST